MNIPAGTLHFAKIALRIGVSLLAGWRSLVRVALAPASLPEVLRTLASSPGVWQLAQEILED
jgi:hypothetical protein